MIRSGDIPQRIVLSRKGFDLSAGGYASPILAGEMISLPIPEHNLEYRAARGLKDCPERHLTYGELPATARARVTELVSQLTKGKIKASDCVHLDPDIRPALRNITNAKLPLTFGQDGGSQTELSKLQEGDLFLFFGWFREVEQANSGSFRFSRVGADVHAIWGWLQISEKLDLPSRLPRAKKIAGHHPHVLHYPDRKPTCLYVGGDALTFLPTYPGAGTFSKFRNELRFSDSQAGMSPRKRLRSKWRLPAFFRDIQVTHIPSLQIQGKWEENGESILGQAANHPGQEFVFNTKGHKEEVAEWLDGIFTGKRRQEI